MAKVLIIEDRRENIVFIANNILKPLGHDVITAMDGETGLSKAKEEAPDLIITDLKLPRLGGLELVAQLQRQGIHIPVIVMTFHGTEETAVQALRLGARDYLVKPFSMEEIHAALDRALKPLAGQKVAASQPPAADGARVAQLEQELVQMRAVLAKREMQIQHMQKQLAECIKKVDLAVVAQRAAAWEEDNARLNQVLAQSKERLGTAESHARALEEAIQDQKLQISRYQQETSRLAEKLHQVTEAMTLLSRDFNQQLKRLEVLAPREKSQG